jgi:hypothetical protein
MAITAKVQYIFGMSKWGWTETFYFQTTGSALENVNANAQALGKARCAMLASDAKLEAIRISDTAGNLEALLKTDGIAFGINSGKPAGSPWNSLLCRISSVAGGSRYNRSLMLRGIPLDYYGWVSTNPVNPQIEGQVLFAIKGLTSALTTSSAGNPSGWCIRGSNRDRTQNPKIVIKGLTTVPPGPNFVVNPTLPIPFAQWDKVHVSGARGPGTRGVNADAYITNIDPTTFALTLSSRQTCAGQTIELKGKPVIYGRNYMYFQITTLSAERWVKRDTGRAFFGTAGRRSSKAC